jgi:hypothetical protein
VASITIHERTTEEGSLVRTTLVTHDGGLALVTGSRSEPLPDGAVEAVLARYGKPMAIALDQAAVEESLELGLGRRLVRFRFRPRYDVIARDYLALSVPGEDPVCELAVAVTGALEHLARSWAAARAEGASGQ